MDTDTEKATLLVALDQCCVNLGLPMLKNINLRFYQYFRICSLVW